MNLQNAGVFAVVLLMISIAAWINGTKHPSRTIKEKIGRDSIQDQLWAWYAGRKFICVETIDNYPGFMGLPIPAVILESNGERIRCSGKIAKGTLVELHPRTDNELKNGVWISAIDQFLKPVFPSE